MSLTEGSKLRRDEIRALIGVGSMGEIYRASDPKIGRDVAIKVQPADFSADKERLARFEQEAQAERTACWKTEAPEAGDQM